MTTTELLTGEQQAQRIMQAADDTWDAGNGSQAEQLAKQALAANPGHAYALHLLGLIAFTRGEHDIALDYLAQACARPDVPAIFCRNLCEVSRQCGRLPEAEVAGRRSVTLDPGLAVAWNSLGAVYFDAGRIKESRDCYARAVEIDPKFRAAANSLATTLYKLGELDLAKRQLVKILDFDETSADAHCTLSLVQGALGEYEEALDHVRRAIELRPNAINAYLNAAAIEAQVGRYDRLFQWVEQAHKIAPDNPHVLLMYANALRRIERFDDALVACRRAIELLYISKGGKQPLADAYDTLGIILMDMERGDEALDAFETANALAESSAVIVNNRGMLLMELGRREEALTDFNHALTLRPDLAMAWHNRADLKKFTADDPDIERMEDLLRRDSPLSYIDQIRLHFALGKAYLDLAAAGSSLSGGEGRGEVAADAAFDHFGRGNGMKRRMLRYDGGEQDRFMRSIAEALPSSVIDALRDAGDMSETPIFVMGMPRSGTTLIEQILASHPLAHGVGEKLYVERLLCAANLISITENGPLAARAVPREALPALGREYLSLVTAVAPGASRIVDKLPANFHYAGYIHLMFPKARIIHCRRNPADTCMSGYCKLFSGQQDFTYDLVELGRYYRGYAAIMDHWRRVLPAESYLEVDYESMVEGLEENVRRLLDFCGLPWDEACLRFYDTKRLVKTASMTQVRSPIYKTSVGRWVRYAKHLSPLLDVLREEPALLGVG